MLTTPNILLCTVKEVGNLSFDKDDQLAVEIVTAAANIRASSFGIPLHSLFEAKGIAGNIVHAVATTNAIIAGLIVIEAIKVLRNDTSSYRWVMLFTTNAFINIIFFNLFDTFYFAVFLLEVDELVNAYIKVKITKKNMMEQCH